MMDNLFTFIDSDMIEDDRFHLFAKVEILFESPEQFITEYESMDAALSSKVKEIIEKQWGKRVADLQDIYVGQFHERLVEGDDVSYRSTNRYVLRAKFHYTREPRRIIFSLTA